MESKFFEFTFNNLFAAIKDPNNVIYEIKGDRVNFSFDGYRYSFSSSANSEVSRENFNCAFSDHAKVMNVVLQCLGVKTVNPKDVWFKLILDSKSDKIQILEAGASALNRLTIKKTKECLKSFSDLRYGKFSVFKNPAIFVTSVETGDFFSKDQEFFFDTPIKDIEKNLKKTIFLNFEKLLLSNCKSKFEDWDTESCRLIRIRTSKGDFRLFRSSKWKNTRDI